MPTLSMSAAASIGAPCTGASLHAGGVSTGRVCPGDSAAGARPADAAAAPPPPAHRQARRCAATSGSTTELRTATSVARPLPQPVFRPGGGHKSAAGRALSRLARVGFARHPEGLALTEGARPAARLSLRLAGLGFPASWAPPGGQRERWRRPQRTEAARGLRLKARTATARGGRGAGSGARAPRAASGRRRRSLQREHSDLPYAQRAAA